MVAELSLLLSEIGVATVLVDPFGTGDSEGDFASADWDRWRRDLLHAAAWSQAEGCRVRGLLGIRLGCALAAEVARDIPGVAATVFWQPVTEGSRMVDHFLRLRVAASMADGSRKETTAELRRALSEGQNVEIAGYDLSGALVAALDRVRLADAIGTHLGEIGWFEIARSETAEVGPNVRRIIDTIRAMGTPVELAAVVGAPFWSSVEIVTNAPLLALTQAFFDRSLSRHATAGGSSQ
jgi:exosortase A-associated hydrolase 2